MIIAFMATPPASAIADENQLPWDAPTLTTHPITKLPAVNVSTEKTEDIAAELTEHSTHALDLQLANRGQLILDIAAVSDIECELELYRDNDPQNETLAQLVLWLGQCAETLKDAL